MGSIDARAGVDGLDVSALAGTISTPLAAGVDRIGLARWLRSALSLLVAIGILAVALPVAFGSIAQGGGVDPVRVFSSSPLVAVEASGGASLSVDGMVPGESRAATVRVANAGTASAAFSLTPHVVERAGVDGSRLSGALRLRITSASGDVLYSGPLGSMPRLALGGVAAGAESVFRFAVTLPDSVGNELQGASLSVGFAWNAS